MVVVAPYCWSAMLGVGRGQGVVLSPILEMATKEAGSKVEELSSYKSLLSPCGVPKLHEPEYPTQASRISEDLSGSGLL